MSTTHKPITPTYTTALLAGGIAGTTVDLSLFPLDTLKTRLQSSQGFFPSGGFRGIYRGVGSAVVGSAPGAAFFFVTYEGVKGFLASQRAGAGSTSTNINIDASDVVAGLLQDGKSVQGSAGTEVAGLRQPLEHMAAASLGEIAACAVRVPTEVIKQRAQAGLHGGSSLLALTSILGRRREIGLRGLWLEMYRGWGITVMREVPFTVIQFPLWEALKGWGRRRRMATGSTSTDVSAAESALYGSVSGAVAAGITAPLDVLKTRVMLSKERAKVWTVLRDIYNSHGVRPFFAGIGPRVTWISIGGAVFLGSYQWAVNALQGGVIV